MSSLSPNDAIEELVEEGKKLMLRASIPMNQESYARERALIGQLGIVLDCAGGIVLLLRSQRVNNADILLRTLVETAIRIRYLYLTSDITNVVRWSSAGFNDQ